MNATLNETENIAYHVSPIHCNSFLLYTFRIGRGWGKALSKHNRLIVQLIKQLGLVKGGGAGARKFQNPIHFSLPTPSTLM